MVEKVAEKKIKKMEAPQACKDGHHAYIVTHWDTSASRKVAVHMMCQHCLMTLDLVELRNINAKWATV